jgi:hypothetical protein
MHVNATEIMFRQTIGFEQNCWLKCKLTLMQSSLEGNARTDNYQYIGLCVVSTKFSLFARRIYRLIYCCFGWCMA